MNEAEKNKFYETLEAVALSQALQLLIAEAEQTWSDDPAHLAMITFFRSLLAKYRRRAGTTRILTDAYGDIKIIDNELRAFNNN